MCYILVIISIALLETCEWAGQSLCWFHERKSGHSEAENCRWVIYSIYIWGKEPDYIRCQALLNNVSAIMQSRNCKKDYKEMIKLKSTGKSKHWWFSALAITAMVHRSDEDDLWLVVWPTGPESPPLPVNLCHDHQQGESCDYCENRKCSSRSIFVLVVSGPT